MNGIDVHFTQFLIIFTRFLLLAPPGYLIVTDSFGVYFDPVQKVRFSLNLIDLSRTFNNTIV